MSTTSIVTLGTPFKGVEKAQDAFKSSSITLRSPPIGTTTPETDIHAAPKKSNKTATINVNKIQTRPLDFSATDSDKDYLSELEDILTMLKGIAQANRVRETATKMLEDVVNRMKRSSTNKPQVSQKDEKPKDKYSEILARMNEFSQEMKGVRKELIEVKTSIATSPTTTEPTYAQALTRTPAPRATPNMLPPEEKRRLE